jgi:hypothetical protein
MVRVITRPTSDAIRHAGIVLIVAHLVTHDVRLAAHGTLRHLSAHISIISKHVCTSSD